MSHATDLDKKRDLEESSATSIEGAFVNQESHCTNENYESSKNNNEIPNDAFMVFLQALISGISGITPGSTFNYTHPEQVNLLRKKLFGLSKSLPASGLNYSASDYEQKYPQDKQGEELADNARVWLTYLDEAGAYDRDRVEGWKDTVDVLLVFAALFSGVITTFVSQASQSLQRDYTRISASLNFETVQLLRAQFSGTPIADVPSSPLNPTSPFTPTTNSFLVNGLWFTSLAISLATALVSVLTKQWLYYYMSAVSGTAREKARVRHFRFRGLEAWKVSLIIDLLPILLHLALGIFLIGVIIFLFPLDDRIAWTIVTIAGITYTFYFVSVILPILYPGCPFTTSLTTYIGILLFSLSRIVLWISLDIQTNPYYKTIHHQMLYWNTLCHQRISQWKDSWQTTMPFVFYQENMLAFPAYTRSIFIGFKKLLSVEILPGFTIWREAKLKRAIQSSSASLDLKALHWLYEISSDPSVHRIIARCVSVHPDPGREFKPETVLEELRWVLPVDEHHLKELRYALCMDFQYDEKNHWHFLRSISDKAECTLDKEYQNYSRVAQSVVNYLEHDRILQNALKHNLEFPLAMWRHFLADPSPNPIMAAHIITSDINLFNWNCDPALNSIYETGIVSYKAQNLSKWFFDYLFRYFYDSHMPDQFSESASFDARHRLLVSIYRNLTGDQPIVTNQKTKALESLFWGFFCWLSHSKPADISSEQLFAFHRDILRIDRFWKRPMTHDTRGYVFICLNKIRKLLSFSEGRQMFFIRCQWEDFSCIFEWCCRDLSGTHRRNTSCIILLLFMPQNRTYLLRKLSSCLETAPKRFSRCLSNLYSPMNSEDEWIKKNYIYPSLMDLFKKLPEPGAFEDWVLGVVWKFIVCSDSDEWDEKDFFQMVKSKLSNRPKRLRELLASMSKEVQREDDPTRRRTLEISKHSFEQTFLVDRTGTSFDSGILSSEKLRIHEVETQLSR